MIQKAINQLLTIGAAVKKATDLTKQNEAKAAVKASRAEEARDKAMKSAKERIEAKWNQNKDYQAFKASLGINNQAPELLKRLAYNAKKEQPEVRIGGAKMDLSRLSPEAQDIIRRAK